MPHLGELEQVIMQTLWDAAGTSLSVREIHVRVTAERDLAYTTVMTVLDRLAKKHLVHRELEGRAWLYRSKQTRAELIADDIIHLLVAMTPDEQQEICEHVAAGLAARGRPVPCADIWPRNSRPKVTPAGDFDHD